VSKKKNPKQKEIHDFDRMKAETKKLLEIERRSPFDVFLLLFLILIIVSMHSLYIGGKGDSLVGIQLCSTSYWLVLISIFPILFTFQYYIVKGILLYKKKKEENKFPFQEGDIRWTNLRAFVTVFISIIAGVLSSLLGIGGGMVIGPLLLELGVLANVSAATSSFMILFTSASSIVQFAALGLIPYDYGLFLFVVGFFYGHVGQSFLNFIVKKYNRKSIIVISVVFIVGISAILLLGSQIYNYVNMPTNVTISYGFRQYC